jgi:hypothetical protein
MAKRWDHMRLGFGVQLGTVRFLGTFVDDLATVPARVVDDMARQLSIGNPDCITVYRDSRARWQHAREIRIRLGYRKFIEPFMRFRLARWLYALCWTGTERPSVLGIAARFFKAGQSAAERCPHAPLWSSPCCSRFEDRRRFGRLEGVGNALGDDVPFARLPCLLADLPGWHAIVRKRLKE